MNNKYAVITAIAAISTSLFLSYSEVEAANFDGEPTIFTNGINSNENQIYEYSVLNNTDSLTFASVIADVEDKPNVIMIISDPIGNLTFCLPSPAGLVLLAMECTYNNPLAGDWVVNYLSFGITNEPLAYALAIDTFTNSTIVRAESNDAELRALIP